MLVVLIKRDSEALAKGERKASCTCSFIADIIQIQALSQLTSLGHGRRFRLSFGKGLTTTVADGDGEEGEGLGRSAMGKNGERAGAGKARCALRRGRPSWAAIVAGCCVDVGLLQPKIEDGPAKDSVVLMDERLAASRGVRESDTEGRGWLGLGAAIIIPRSCEERSNKLEDVCHLTLGLVSYRVLTLRASS